MTDIKARIAGLSPAQAALLQEKLGSKAAPSAPQPSRLVQRHATGQPAPLSFGQERLWLIDQIQPGSPAYNVPVTVPLFGPVNAALLQRCIEEIVRRHDILRTTFAMRDGRLVQIAGAAQPIRLPLIELDGLAAELHEAELQRIITAEIRRPFDLSTGPLIRAVLLRLLPREGEPSHLLLCVMHHIVSDAWSIGVLLRELGSLYEAYWAGQPSPLGELPIQYADFAIAERRRLDDGCLAPLVSYWKERLDGAPQVLNLPTDRPRTGRRSDEGAVSTFSLPAAIAAKVRALGERLGATPFMTTLAAFILVLSRYVRSGDIVVGTPVTSRNSSELESLIGFFLNTLVLRTRIAGDPTFAEFLCQVRDGTLEAFRNQDMPFEMLVDALKPDRNLATHPFFQVMFVMQAAIQQGTTTVEAIVAPSVASGKSRFDLTLSLCEVGGRIDGFVEYSTSLFDPGTIARLCGHYRTCLDDAVHHPEKRLSEIAQLSAEEHDQLRRWNDTAQSIGAAECIHHILERAAAARPEAVALDFEGRTLSYGELNRQANQLANHLLTLGVGPDVVVGIFTERSIEMIVGLFGILKAGGAYLPLDPRYPGSRLAFMLADTKVQVVLTHTACAGQLPEFGGQVVDLVRDWSAISRASSDDPRSHICGDHAAYVIYTSGSSGQPKGVLVPHRGVCNAGEVEHRLYRTGPGDRVLQFASLNFDASIFEIIMSLRGGSILQLVTAEEARSGVDLVRLVEARGVTVLAMPPSALAVLPVAALPTLRLIIVMGEDCPAELRARWRHVPEFFNCYGPTEASMWMTGTFLHPDHPVTIGRPIANTSAHLLDEHLYQVPVGVPGELFIGGVCVTRGYIGRPALTAERFVPDPFSATPGARLYRTGDLAAYTPEGDICFLGRLDLQIKVRGFRVELGEIEAALSCHPGVQAAAVAVRDDLPSGRGLVGYVMPGAEAPSTSELRSFLLGRLPDYMVPAVFVILDSLPLNQAAKVDRQALPAPRRERPTLDTPFVAPTTSMEQTTCRIWATLLGRDSVGIDDNFFELGGHSLLATQIIARMRDAFGIDLPIRAVFDHPTVGDLSALVEEELRRQSVPIAVPTPDRTEHHAVEPIRKKYSLSFAQERLWFLRQLDPEDRSYNIPLEFPLWNVDPERLRQCLNTLVQRHEILRTTFHAELDGPVQVVSPALNLDMPVVEVAAETAAAQKDDYQRIRALAAAHRFNLETGPLLCASLVRFAGGACSLLIIVDHIIFDGWSAGVLYGEIAKLYDATLRDLPSPLAPLSIQYGTYAERQRARLRGVLLEQHRDFWTERLKGIPGHIELPLDHPRQRMAGHGPGALYVFDLPDAVAGEVRALAQAQHMTNFIVLLAAFQAFLWRYTRQDTVVIGSPVTNRNESDTEALIGLFVNMLVLRADLSPGMTFRGLVGQVRETVITAHEHQELPFENLIEALRPERDPTVNPIFQVMFALHQVGSSPDWSPPMMGQGAKLDLSLHVSDDNRVFRCVFEYRTELFEAATIERMSGHLAGFIAHVVEHIDLPLADAPLVGPAEQNALSGWHQTATDEDTTVPVYELFVAHAALTPDKIAAICEDARLSYAELDRLSTRLAQHLRALGIREESLVGVCLPRSLDLMVAVLGVLKAGAVYVPLDPDYPDERLRLIIGDADPMIVLAGETEKTRLQGLGVRLLSVDDGLSGEGLPQLPERAAGPRNAAYVIYTSGSTGIPKGVVNTQGALSNRLLWMQQAFHLADGDRVLHKTSIGFDVSVWELLWPVITGAAVVLAAPGRHRDADYVARTIARFNVTHVHFVPSMLWTFLNEVGPITLPSLRCVIASGETLPLVLQDLFFARLRNCTLENLYGPTEAAIDVTRWRCRPDPNRHSVPIGHAIANTRLYVLDRHLNELPVNVAGDLYIAGMAPARGYLGHPALTAERFLPDPIGAEPGGRMYHTGDLGRRLPAGEIEFLGRVDDQVKLRGVRIELGEIRTALLRHPAIADAVVVNDGPNGSADQRLIAYYVRRPGQQVQPTELRRRLHEILPLAMVPAVYLELEAVPLTANGKLNPRALPKPGKSRLVDSEAAAPADALEAFLISLWADTLRVESVGTEDNFFDLGGHSLLAMRVLSRLRAMLGVDIAASHFFNVPTPTLLAAEILSRADDQQAVQARAHAIMTVANLSDQEVEVMLGTTRLEMKGASR
ncbi:non-ribosomal peptide synthetase [Bradyrhizobium sp. CCBAU 051011]|uniref:non-ribosomal peptide synthetase n=1 Tax=Bradyrhizobium sp. CCBAU 051011 TaxID=858422 RepID=UPI00137AF86E|nr:non-ribosomal peptide synthetase [Bradyrhizobium sp. CCBAU 051011]